MKLTQANRQVQEKAATEQKRIPAELIRQPESETAPASALKASAWSRLWNLLLGLQSTTDRHPNDSPAPQPDTVGKEEKVR